MGPKKSFFLPGKCNDKEYEYIRDSDDPEAKEARGLIEALWPEFEPLADSDFQTDAPNQFLQRFWEMYVAMTFKRAKFQISKQGGGGPDFLVESQGLRVWLEANAPLPGGAPNAVPPMTEELQDYPESQIIMRLTNSLDSKRKQFEDAEKKGSVLGSDCYIVAINAKAIPFISSRDGILLMLKAFLGVGEEVLEIDSKTRRITGHQYNQREFVRKSNASPVDTKLFLMREYSNVSGVLYSRAYPLPAPKELGEDFVFLHNPLAKNPIPEDFFRFKKQYQIKNGGLSCIEP